MNQVKQTLKTREVVILGLDNQCEHLTKLAKTLIDALKVSLNHESLSYDERRALKDQTKSMCTIIDEDTTRTYAEPEVRECS